MRVVNQEIANLPVAELRVHPRNPNEGDVGAIYESIEANGFYGVIGVQKSTGYILWGNHRFEAALQAGAQTIPAAVLDVDDAEALRILLVDNRSARLGEDDDRVLAEVLQSLMDTEDGLKGTGYEPSDLDELLESLGAATTFDDETPDDEILTYGQIEFTVRLARAQVTPEVEARFKAFAEEVGGRFLIRGAKE